MSLSSIIYGVLYKSFMDKYRIMCYNSNISSPSLDINLKRKDIIDYKTTNLEICFFEYKSRELR